ncbi:SixA phosphatase family protein [Solicola sp. PLA-1-18]|uniref:SixA phosphatase family protein n=1 Tax=Solicola sp. PLA-1-18 TaxID=3380532 RepID=UPI003B7FF254
MDDTLGRHLVIVRHGKAEQSGPTDHARRLADRGLEDASRLGTWIAGLALAAPAVAYVSSAARTTATWEQLAPSLEALDVEVEVRDDLYAAGSDEARAVVADTDPEVRTVLVVGHNPTMTALALQLADTPGETHDRLSLQGLPTCGCAVVGLAEWGAPGGDLTAFVTPREY